MKRATNEKNDYHDSFLRRSLRKVCNFSYLGALWVIVGAQKEHNRFSAYRQTIESEELARVSPTAEQVGIIFHVAPAPSRLRSAVNFLRCAISSGNWEAFVLRKLSTNWHSRMAGAPLLRQFVIDAAAVKVLGDFAWTLKIVCIQVCAYPHQSERIPTSGPFVLSSILSRWNRNPRVAATRVVSAFRRSGSGAPTS